MERRPNPAPGPIARAGAGMPYPFDRANVRDRPELAGFVFLPGWFRVSILLGHNEGDNQKGSVQLSPEDFILYRIGWCTNGDTYPFVNIETASLAGSSQGRTVECLFRDEYTEFITDPCLITALFGDSQGFLDIPQGLQFKGKQTLKVELNRISYPGEPPETPPQSRFDFSFQGVRLLTPGMPVSGSAG